MSANSTAFDYVNGFRWRLGDPALADSEAHLYDLGVLRSVLEESVEIAVAVADARARRVASWDHFGSHLGVNRGSFRRRTLSEALRAVRGGGGRRG